jgi:antitoxin YefM
MARETTYTYARDHLAELLDGVEGDRGVVIIRRRGHEDAALLAASELTGLLETAHLVRSPKNARRIFDALRHALDEEGAAVAVNTLRRDMGLETREGAG